MGQIKFVHYTVTTSNFFVITIHYVNVVFTPTICDPLKFLQIYIYIYKIDQLSLGPLLKL